MADERVKIAIRFICKSIDVPTCKAVCRELDLTDPEFDTIARENPNDIESQKVGWLQACWHKRGRSFTVTTLETALQENGKQLIVDNLQQHLKEKRNDSSLAGKMQAMSIASSEPRKAETTKDLLRELKDLSEFTESQFSSLVSTFPLSDEQVQQLGENKYSVCNFIDYWGKMNLQPEGRHLVKVLEKDLGRKDIGEVLRKHFPSGTAGPKGDDEARLLNMPFKVRQKLIAVLSVRDSNAADPHDWRAVADRIGLDGTTMMLFGQTELPMERVFKAWDVRDDATIGNLYTILVELGMPVYADYL